MRFGQPTLQPCLRCRVRALFCPLLKTRAISSVVERLLHTQEVAGSNPASRTIVLGQNLSAQFKSHRARIATRSVTSGSSNAASRTFLLICPRENNLQK